MKRPLAPWLSRHDAAIAFRADDAGAATGITEGIILAICGGLVKNVSVMVPPPAFHHARDRLQELRGVEFGLHLTLNCEWLGQRWRPVAPPAKIPTLLDADGYFLATPEILSERQPAIEQLLTEARAQLARLRATGLPVTYLDEHMGVGWLPGLRQALVQLAYEEDLVHADAAIPFFQPLQDALADPDKLRALLPQLTGTHLAICHFALDDTSTQSLCFGATQSFGEVAAARAAELATVTNPALLSAYAAGSHLHSVTMRQAAARLQIANKLRT